MDLYEKTAFWPMVRAGASAIGKGAFNFGKGLLFADAAKGAGAVGKGMNMAGKATATLGPIAASMGTTTNAGPAASVAGMEFKAGSLDERLFKLAFAMTPVDMFDAANYLAFAGSKLIPKSNPWHHRLEYGGLTGLGLSTGYEMMRTPGERKPGIKDLIGLALMASAVHDRSQSHDH